MRIFWTVIILITVSSGQADCARWYKCLIHAHSTFSDGSNNIPQLAQKAKSARYDCLIVTDHYRQIDSKEKAPAQIGRVANPKGVDFGFADYVRNCREQTTGSFACIPGAEIETFWKAESNTRDASHTLALGPIPDHPDSSLCYISQRLDSQRKILDRIDELDMLSVAAHPTLIATYAFKIRPWEWQRCRYDFRNKEAYGRSLNGVEMMNTNTDKQDDQALSLYSRLIREKLSVFVTSGSDTHGWIDSKDSERWLKATWVFAEDLTPSSILEAIKEGRTYSTRDGIYITHSNLTPCFFARKQSRASFDFSFGWWSGKKPNKLLCVMYRDGSRVDASAKSIGSNSSYTWSDNTRGYHRYNLVVDTADGKLLLVSSPFTIDVN